MLTKEYLKLGIEGPIYATTLDSTFILPSVVDRIEVHDVAEFTKGGNLGSLWRRQIEFQAKARAKKPQAVKTNLAVKAEADRSAAPSNISKLPEVQANDGDEESDSDTSPPPSQDRETTDEPDMDNDDALIGSGKKRAAAPPTSRATKRSREGSHGTHKKSATSHIEGKGKESEQDKKQGLRKDAPGLSVARQTQASAQVPEAGASTRQVAMSSSYATGSGHLVFFGVSGGPHASAEFADVVRRIAGESGRPALSRVLVDPEQRG